jgi:hypothetical protein
VINNAMRIFMSGPPWLAAEPTAVLREFGGSAITPLLTEPGGVDKR